MTEGVNGGIYEPIRAKICGPGPCSPQQLEEYRGVLMVVKQVEDAIAAQCFELGRSQHEKITREQLKAAILNIGDATITLRQTEFFKNLLRDNV